MDEMEKAGEWYLATTYNDAKKIIRINIRGMAKNFIAVGFYLKHIRDNRMYEEDGCTSIWDFADDQYGISRSTASRWISMNDRFSENGNSPNLSDAYKDFGKSQLQEMLYLPDGKLEEVTADMTVKEIRQIRGPEKPEPEKPELPVMRNNDQRKAFLDSYQTWPIWFEVPEASEVYYRYNLPDGTSIVIREYHMWLDWKEKYSDQDPHNIGTREYLLKPGYHYLYDCLTNRTALVEKLKEVQKK